MTTVTHAPTPPGLFDNDVYIIRKRIFKLLGSAFRVYDSDGIMLFYVNQKAFKLKEDIRVYLDEQKTNEVLTIKARQVIDFSAGYDVFDTTTHEKVGSLRRKGLKSIIRDEWLVLDANDRQIGKIQEDSAMLALVRRFIDFASLLMPQKFTVLLGESPVATFRQNHNIFVPRITCDFSLDTGHGLDRRLGIAAAILLAAIEGRQS